MLLFGLHGLRIVRIPFLDREARPALARVQTGGSVAAAFVFGVAFAVGWSPCIGPLLASALTYTASHSSHPLRGAALLAVYASGIAIPLIATAALADRAVGWLRRSGSVLPRIERATGALLVGVGLWMAYDSRIVSDALLIGKPTIAGPQLIEFTSQDCPACRRMEPVLARAQASCAGLGARMLLVDVGTARGLELARSLNVVATPTFVIVGGDNTEHARLIGELPLRKLQASVERAFGLECAPSSG
jgi:cytochrome c-type biogenesis protein